MKGFVSIILALMMGIFVPLVTAQQGSKLLETNFSETVSRVPGTTNFSETWVYLGDVSECWHSGGLGVSKYLGQDSLVFGGAYSHFSSRSTAGDSAAVSYVVYLSLIKENPNRYIFDWADSAGTKKWAIASDSLSTSVGTAKNGTMMYSSFPVATGALTDTTIFPHVWVKVRVDSLSASTDMQIENIRHTLGFQCLK